MGFLLSDINAQFSECTPKNFNKINIEKNSRASTINTTVQTYIVVPNDLALTQEMIDSVYKAMQDIHSWYQLETGGVTFEMIDSIIIYNCLQGRAYYDTAWWGNLLPEMSNNGVPVWQAGNILALWILGPGGYGIGLGAQGCGTECGVAMAAIEGWPGFNPGTYCIACPPTSVPSGSEWPCVPRGTMAHELGHAFGLAHSNDSNVTYFYQTNPYAFHSVMSAHWNFPYTYAVGPNDAPWGLLTKEIQELKNNPVFKSNISLTQTYPDAPLVNLPPLSPTPVADFSYQIINDTILFNNLSSGASLYYWIFGDGDVSNDINPNHVYSQNGTYKVQLRASNDSAMISEKTAYPNILLDDPGKNPQEFILVYPNPFKNEIRIQLNDNMKNQYVDLKIDNILGQNVRLIEGISSNEITVDMRNLANGAYFLSIHTEQLTFNKILLKRD